ncbi:divalent metal cation transporter [Patescibacteria group bacterium]|jgi:NRAMP (natural resistance-associated macrophage protein)-like metal ion transporter|nr:divalent metal cation transporter [Patescibacteria group bacterium]
MENPLRRFFRHLGPGFITGASDDDPSGIATYTAVGARFGFGLLWTSILVLPFMIAIQETVARIGMVTGEGLTAAIRKRSSRATLLLVVFLVFVANSINIGANLGAMGDALRLLVPQIPFAVATIGFTILILILEIFVTYKTYAKILKWLALTLLAYLLTAILVTTNWSAVLKGALIPHFELTKDFVLAFIAVLGTTISPYLLLWQANEEVEEEIANGRKTVNRRKGANAEELQEMHRDVTTGMTFSNLIMFCIILTAASVFFSNGIHDIATSADAAKALTPLAGKGAFWLYTIGIIGTGLLAIPILSASASYALSEAFGWKNGLAHKLHEAHGFYGAITIATLIGLLLNFSGIAPIQALIWAAIVNGLVTPVILFVVLKIANDPKLMGEHVNGLASNILVGFTAVIMTGAAGLLFWLS